MPSWTKSKITDAGTRLIVRERLLSQLDAAVASPLTLLLAPAGSGKSTLLAQWLDRRDPQQTVVLSLTAADASPVRFFRRWIEALRRVAPGFDTFSYNQLVADVALPADAVAESLLHSFQRITMPLVIVLDDFQHERGTLVEQVLSLIIDQMPEHVRILLATRVQPGLSLARLQLEDKLRVVDREDLDLSRDELCELAALMCGRALTDEERDQLMAMTEGWMAGIRFALLAFGHQPRGGDQDLASSHPALIDYFAQVVVADLPEGERDLVMRSAILERFNPALCDVLTGRQDSALIIERLLSRELFIQPLPDQPGWFRFHTLFQEFLRNRLQVEAAAAVPALHRLAANWLMDAGEPEQALSHAQRSTDRGLFLAMLEASCDQWSKAGELPTLLRWVGELPEEQIIANSDLGFLYISALILTRRFNQARYYMDLLAATPRDRIRGRFAEDSHGPFLDTMLELFQHDTSFRMSDDRARLMGAMSQHDMRAFSLAILAYHHLLRAEFPAALEHAQRAKDVLAQLGYHFLESYADLILVLCDRHSGRMLQSVQSATNMFWRHEQGRRHSPAWVNAATAMAVVRYEQNMLDDAQRLCEELIPLVSSACATEVIAAAYLTLVRVLHLRGEDARATRLMSHLDRVLQLGLYDRFVAQLAHESMRQAFSRDLPAVNRVADQYQLSRRLARGAWAHPVAYDEGWERYGLATALWLRARHDYNEASQLLSRLAAVLRRDRVMARLVVVEANQAVLLALQGQRQQALEWLRRIMAEHGPECVNRTVFDEAPGLAELLAEAIDAGVVRVPSLYRQMFSDLLVSQPDQDEPADVVPDQFNLTQREAEILLLLRQGLSNQGISTETGVALSTIKWHLKNIFAKLGVSSRAEAIVHCEQVETAQRSR